MTKVMKLACVALLGFVSISLCGPGNTPPTALRRGKQLRRKLGRFP